MDSQQTLDILDKYFNTFELLGSESIDDYVTILYLMFIDEYYEFNRNISLEDIDNNEIGLTDCLVRKLNDFLECLKSNSNILNSVDLDYLPTKNHWIIPDIEDEEDLLIKDKVLFTIDYIDDYIFYTENIITDKILQ